MDDGKGAKKGTGAAPRTLALLRHAKASWPAGITDRERPLAPRGRQALPGIARWLGANAPRPDRVLVSHARRTRETFALLSGEVPGLEYRFEPRIYEASAVRLLEVIGEADEACRHLLMIGHNPGMQDLAEWLIGEAEAPGDLTRLSAKFPTSGLAILALPEKTGWADLAMGAGRLLTFMTPAMLGGIDED